METGGELRSVEPLSIEQGQTKGSENHKYGLTSAHTTDHDSWQQVGLLLVTGFNCGWILSFSNLMLVPLGWTWGIICLFVVGLFSAYANWLLAAFHFIDGQRFIRYRDLMGFLFGREMYYITWVSQYLTLLLGNMGFILLGGKALKEINSELSDSPLRLQYFIIITGAAYFIFALVIPTMSAMRSWLGVSTILTFTFITIILLVLIHDGTDILCFQPLSSSNLWSPVPFMHISIYLSRLNSELILFEGKYNRSRDYEIPGSKVGKVFNAFGAISAIIVCNNSGLLLEIQSTLRKPAVNNMRKALYVQYTVGLIVYYGVIIVGYWAYGSAVSVYLPEELSGPKWAKVIINACVILQSIAPSICLSHQFMRHLILGSSGSMKASIQKKTSNVDSSCEHSSSHSIHL